MIKCPHCGGQIEDPEPPGSYRKQLKELHAQGMTLMEAAAALNRKPSAVGPVAKRAGLVFPHQRKDAPGCSAEAKPRWYNPEKGRRCLNKAAHRIDGDWLCHHHSYMRMVQKYGAPIKTKERCLVPSAWFQDTPCQNFASIVLSDGRMMCKEHAGKFLFGKYRGRVTT